VAVPVVDALLAVTNICRQGSHNLVGEWSVHLDVVDFCTVGLIVQMRDSVAWQ